MSPEPLCLATSYLDLGFIRSVGLGGGGERRIALKSIALLFVWRRGGALLGKEAVLFLDGPSRSFQP